MTLSARPDRVDPAAFGGSRLAPEQPDGAVPKRPPRWSVSNWPVRWKVLGIALVPMVLAMVFGGLRVASALTDASRLRLAADRAELVPAITDYMSALDGALVAASSGGDVQGTKKRYESRKYELYSRLSGADVVADVRSGVATLIDGGQSLLDRVVANTIGLRDQVTSYAPILLTAEDAINGSVRVDSERIRAQTEGLSRAVGARGQMMMQELLVNRGGELPEPELRTSMITLAGTEPSTLFGMSQVLGVDSADAKRLQQQMVTRMAIMSNPDSVLPNNADLRDSLRSTDEIAARVIEETTGAVTGSLADHAADRRNVAIRDTVLILAAVVAALLVVGLVARSLVRPLRTLRDGALQVAHAELEQGIARVRAGSGGSERDPAPLPVYTTEEIGQVAHAVDELHAQALLLAGDEARLRRLVNEMFETMSRRNRSLVDQQLSLIDRLERNESDPDRLDALFRLDHLAARMRRNGANLLVLAGARISQDRGRSVPLSTVVSAAISEVEDYRRVHTATVPDVMVTGAATGDTVHLLAELIDNALRYSPPTEQVWVSAMATDDAGVLIEIIDSGLGMTDGDLRIANMRLATGGELSPENARHMGLFVVSRLAHRHGIGIRLTRAKSLPARGIVAGVYLPPSLLVGSFAGDQPEPHRTPDVNVASTRVGATSRPARSVAHRGRIPEGQTAGSTLPQRDPGGSGITGGSAPTGEQARPTGTAAYFSARARAERARAHWPGSEPPDGQPEQPDGPVEATAAAPEDADVIYQRMLSEWLVDPHELGRSPDLNWKTVWDHGWSLAAEAENVPVASHTEQGLPIREPGARLVPGSPAGPSPPDGPPSRHQAEPGRPVPSNGESRRGAHRAPERDPDAVRASISSHFGGVRAGRSHAREPDPETNPETDQEADHR